MSYLQMTCGQYYDLIDSEDNMSIIKTSDIIDSSALLHDLNELNKSTTLLREKSNKLRIKLNRCEYCNSKIQSNKTNCVNCGAPN